MNRLLYFIILIFLIPLSCQDVKRGLGLEKVRPDEFLVQKKGSLELPPNFDLIEPGGLKLKKNKVSLTQILNKSLTPDKVLNIEESGISNTAKDLEQDLLKKIK